MQRSRKFGFVFGLLALAAIGAVSVASPQESDDQETEEAISVDELPTAVKEAALKASKGAKIREVDRETEDGKTLYSVEMVVETQIEVELTEDGTIVELEIGDDADDDAEDDDADE